jgi:5'-nucleotidase
MRLFFSFLLLFSFTAHAKLLEIIHTNDLHSYFTGYYTGDGGYARVQTKIKQLREEAQAKNIEVLQLDAGDWGEGTAFYHSSKGNASLKALDLLGIEIAAIGNHDHMMGGKTLGEQIRTANVKTKFVAANIQTTPDMNLGKTVFPYVDVERAGIKIRVIGLTTAELFFQYSMAPGKILDPVKVGESEGVKAKKAGRELVIALTHIGIKKDIKLGQQSSSIDVIIGGHSHTRLDDIQWAKNTNGYDVPIVQAWAHGLTVGTLLLDVKDDGKVEVVDYKLHDVSIPLMPDPEMNAFINNAIQKRNDFFSGRWNEVVGFSDIPMSGYRYGRPIFNSSCWGKHMATAAKEAANANVGIHISNFEGAYKPPGPVTFGDIADNFPHFRKFGDPGWEIATITLSGYLLKPLMYIVTKLNVGVSFSGLGYKNNFKNLDDKALYTMAFPAEVAFAIKTSYPKYYGLLRGMRYTGKYYWPVIIDYVRKNSPVSCR